VSQKFGPHSPRIQLAAVATALAALAALLEYFPPQQYAIYPFCPVNHWLGLQCPGCGITRAAVDLMSGRFAEAARHNPLIYVLGPVAAIFAGVQGYSVYRWNRWREIRISNAWLAAVCAFLLGFTIVRNVV
jgi:hypothetical protein